MRKEKIIVGKLRIISKTTDDSIDFLIRDEKKESLRVLPHFTYFSEERIEEHPDLAAGRNRYYRLLVHGVISELSPNFSYNNL